MKPSTLSRELRKESGEFLEQRRGIVALGLAACGCMSLIALYQIGILKHLPEPPLPGFDADKVDAADEAYSYFQTPDAFIGLQSYAATVGLAAMGGKHRAKRHPWIPLLLLGKVLIDAANAAKLTWDQKSKHHAFCLWCILAALATFVTVPLAIPEALAARRSLRRDKQHTDR